jgi:hypothetical protein
MKNVPEQFSRRLVDFSDIFSGLEKALDHYINCNEHRPIFPDFLLLLPDSIVEIIQFLGPKDSDTESEILEVIRRLKVLPDDVYVELKHGEYDDMKFDT